jgi:hypothetical protein
LTPRRYSSEGQRPHDTDRFTTVETGVLGVGAQEPGEQGARRAELRVDRPFQDGDQRGDVPNGPDAGFR